VAMGGRPAGPCLGAIPWRHYSNRQNRRFRHYRHYSIEYILSFICLHCKMGAKVVAMGGSPAGPCLGAIPWRHYSNRLNRCFRHYRHHDIEYLLSFLCLHCKMGARIITMVGRPAGPCFKGAIPWRHYSNRQNWRFRHLYRIYISITTIPRWGPR
jgi:hypothetical protein